MKNEDNHLDNLTEWQNNQYNPGHYVGNGKITPFVKAKGNLHLAKIFYLIMGSCVFIYASFLLYQYVFGKLSIDLFTILLSYGVSILFILVGWGYHRKEKTLKR